MDPDFVVRDARSGDINRLAEIWHDGWKDAHSAILPPELARHRTYDSFRERLIQSIKTVRAVETRAVTVGFSMLKQDELNQFYLTASARGTGAAGALMEDALMQLRNAGHKAAWLACGIGNDRAARFYEKSGWRLAETFSSSLETPEGVFALDVWRYIIDL